MAGKSYAELQSKIEKALDEAGISRGIWRVSKGRLEYLSGRGVKRRRCIRSFERTWDERMIADEVRIVVAQIRREDLEPAL